MAKTVKASKIKNRELEELKTRLAEAEDTLEAIRTGAIDALVVSGEEGERIFSLQSADYSYRVMVENMNEGAVTLDKNGTIVFANRAFSILAGRQMSTLVGLRFSGFLPGSCKEKYSTFVNKCLIRPHRDEFQITYAQGIMLPVSISGTAFEINGIKNVCLIISDLSERKEAESRLQAAYDKVEQKVIERTTELRESEERFRSVLDNSEDVIYRLNGQTGRYEYISPSVEKALGYSPGELMNLDFRGALAMIHPEDLPAFHEAKARLEETGSVIVDYRQRTKSGAYCWLSNYISLIKGSSGRPFYYNGNIRDITARKKAEDASKTSELKYRRLFEAAKDGILILDFNSGSIVDVNKFLIDMLEYSFEDLLHKHLWDIGVFKDIAASQEAFAELQNKEFIRYEYLPLETKSGKKKAVEFVSNVYLVDHAKVIQCNIRDITKRKQAEDALQQKAEELAFANNELESFSYTVAHDLRNPLHSITALIALFSNPKSANLSETEHEALNRIDQAANRMASVITDLLVLSKVSRQPVERKSVDLATMVRKIFNDLKAVEPCRNVLLEIKSEGIVEADSGLTQVLLENLIGNAWKYSSKIPDAHIEFGIAEGSKPSVWYVRDNGAGFDMTKVDQIFKPFKRLHSDKEFPGSGIGLATVKRIVDKHNGKVWAESEVGKGATFFFTLGNMGGVKDNEK